MKSKSIQTLKGLEAKAVEQISSLSPSDPRRIQLRDRLSGLRAQINNENGAVTDSISRTVRIARAHVQALETAVQKESEIAQESTVAGSTLRQLTSDLEAKRQLYVAFLTHAGQVRISAVQAPSARILFQGVPPQRPVYSFGVISLLLGFLGGVVGAAGIIMMRSTLSLKINSTDEMAIVTGLRVFGSLPDFKQDILEPQTGSLVTETFRAMWLAMHSPQNEGTVILVTSSESGEGKTTIASALACRFAGDGFRVLLIDADLRRPRLATILKQRPGGYLETVLSGTVTLDKAVVYDTELGLSCLLANGSLENPIRALSSDHFEQLLTASRRAYDFVILDSPPVLHVADPVLLAKFCQHVIFIVEAGRVPGEQVGEATRRFPAEDRAKMFALLTRVRPSHLDKRDYYSGYARIAGPEHNHRTREGILIQHLRRHGGDAMNALLAVVTASVTIGTKAGAGGLVLIWKELRRGYARIAELEHDYRSRDGVLTQHLRRCCGEAMSALVAIVTASVTICTKGLVLIGKQLQRGYARIAGNQAMKFVVHGVLENQSSDPCDALDLHKGYELSDSAATARRRPRMSPGVFGLHRIAAVNSSVYGLATVLLRVTVFLSIFALGANAQDTVPPTAAGMRLSFREIFLAPLSWCSERCQTEKWRTKYNHSDDRPLSRGLGMSGSEGEILLDPTYLGLGVTPFHIDHGTLSLLIEPASERVKSLRRGV